MRAFYFISILSLLSHELSRKHLSRLLKLTAAPYQAQLIRWIHTGAIHDPNAEFMVVERSDLRKETISQEYNDIYWDNRYKRVRLPYCLCRYTLRAKCPLWLTEWQEKVLVAGKYLNVLRECQALEVGGGVEGAAKGVGSICHPLGQVLDGGRLVVSMIFDHLISRPHLFMSNS